MKKIVCKQNTKWINVCVKIGWFVYTKVYRSPKCLPNQWTTNQIKGTSIVRDYVHGQFDLQLYQ